ncbi:unnamed protein product, partial [Oikopleura dioica]
SSSRRIILKMMEEFQFLERQE